MKVQATAKGFFNGSKVRKGEIFYIKPKKGKHSPDKGMTDYLVDIEMTEEDQFSERWMIKLDEPESPELDQAHNDALKHMDEASVMVNKSKAGNKIEDDKKTPEKTSKDDEKSSADKDDEEVI